MSDTKKNHTFLLKLMYAVTIIIAGGLGIGILAISGTTQWLFGVDCPQIISGLVGSVFLAFAVVSVLGLRDPVKFVPVLLMQLLYKSAWLCFVALPLLIAGKITADLIPVIAVFLAVIVGDLFAIPFQQFSAGGPHNVRFESQTKKSVDPHGRNYRPAGSGAHGTGAQRLQIGGYRAIFDLSAQRIGI